jgi:hypothetical protein
MQATIALKLLDPGSWPGALFLPVVTGLLSLAAIAVLGWGVGPFKWWWRSRTLRKLILRRREFVLVYNPQSGASKPIILLDGGQIGEGRNNNEDSWRIRRGCLEFLADDHEVFSRFKLDQARGRLSSTDDPDVRSLFGQYLLPQYRDRSVSAQIR